MFSISLPEGSTLHSPLYILMSFSSLTLSALFFPLLLDSPILLSLSVLCADVCVYGRDVDCYLIARCVSCSDTPDDMIIGLIIPSASSPDEIITPHSRYTFFLSSSSSHSSSFPSAESLLPKLPSPFSPYPHFRIPSFLLLFIHFPSITLFTFLSIP